MFSHWSLVIGHWLFVNHQSSIVNRQSVNITIKELLKRDFRDFLVWPCPQEKCLTILKKDYKLLFKLFRDFLF